MTLRYIDSSVIVSLFDAHESGIAAELIANEQRTICSLLVFVEVTRNLARRADPNLRGTIQEEFTRLFRYWTVIKITDDVWFRAAEVGSSLGVKSLDAIHLATALSVRGEAIEFATFDRRQAVAARSLGMTVLGVN